MANVRLVEADQAPLLARPYYEPGDPGPIVAALAHVPSALLRCRYCVEAHTVVALDAGLSPAEVRVLLGLQPTGSVFTDPAEVALLGWVEGVAGRVGPVDPALRAALAGHFDDHEVVELTLVAGATLMLNRFCTALELPTSPPAVGAGA